MENFKLMFGKYAIKTFIGFMLILVYYMTGFLDAIYSMKFKDAFLDHTVTGYYIGLASFFPDALKMLVALYRDYNEIKNSDIKCNYGK